ARSILTAKPGRVSLGTSPSLSRGSTTTCDTIKSAGSSEPFSLEVLAIRALSHWRANEPWLPDRRRWLCSLGLVRAPGEQRSEPGQDAPTFPPLLRQCRK